MTPNQLRTFLLTLLTAQSNLQVWDGAPGDGTDSLGYRPGEPDVAIDGDGRAHMYAALYVSPGGRNLEDERMSATGSTTVATFQVTAAGGDANRCLLAVQKVNAALEGRRVTGGGIIRVDADPGTPRIDREPTPSRHYVPLLFRVALG